MGISHKNIVIYGTEIVFDESKTEFAECVLEKMGFYLGEEILDKHAEQGTVNEELEHRDFSGPYGEQRTLVGYDFIKLYCPINTWSGEEFGLYVGVDYKNINQQTNKEVTKIHEEIDSFLSKLELKGEEICIHALNYIF